MSLIQSTTGQRPKGKPLAGGWRFFSGLVVLLFALGITGAIYQTIGAQADRRNFPPPGQLYDIGGYRLHLYCTGPLDTQNPTVILETLAGGTSVNWAWIQPEIARVTRVCSYDRAGRGWSDPGPRIQTLQQTAADLYSLLQKAQVTGPYVLVGHSIGGIYMRKFAADYPDEVAGITLVDSSHPDQFVRFPEMQAGLESEIRSKAIYPALAWIGLWRLYFSASGEVDFGDLPPRQHAEAAVFWSSPEYLTSAYAEAAAEPALFGEAHTLGSLGSLPLAVISRGKEPPASWVVLQNELAALSNNSVHIIVADATHASLALNQKHASEVSRAILQVIEAAQTGRLLTSK